MSKNISNKISSELAEILEKYIGDVINKIFETGAN